MQSYSSGIIATYRANVTNQITKIRLFEAITDFVRGFTLLTTKANFWIRNGGDQLRTSCGVFTHTISNKQRADLLLNFLGSLLYLIIWKCIHSCRTITIKEFGARQTSIPSGQISHRRASRYVPIVGNILFQTSF